MKHTCYRGCGQEATFYSEKTGWRCFKASTKCPVVKQKIGSANAVALLGNKDSEETKRRKSESAKGRIVSDETREKIRESNKRTWAENPKEVWNKGLTANDPRVAAYANKQRGTKRKKESAKVLSRTDPIYRDFKKYRNRIAVQTNKTYEMFKEEINPNNHPRGKAGIAGAYHLDHITTVRQGFDKGIPIEEMSSKENLQMLTWLENIQKYDGKKI